MQFAGPGIRAVAAIIDMAIFFAVAYLIAAMTGQTTEAGFNLTGGPFFLAVVVFFAYFIVLEAIWGATLGKLLCGLRVTTENGGKITWRDSLVRNVLRIVDGIFFYLVGFILVLRSPKRQRLGDRVAATIVVQRPQVAG